MKSFVPIKKRMTHVSYRRHFYLAEKKIVTFVDQTEIDKYEEESFDLRQ